MRDRNSVQDHDPLRKFGQAVSIMTLKMPGLNEEFRGVFANREFIQLQSFATSQSAEAREER